LTHSPALALANGSVWIAWASGGDLGAYHGWILGFDAANLTKSTAVFNDTPDGSDGGIWMSGGGVAVGSSGDLYAASGNGSFNGNRSGGNDYGDTVFRLTPESGELKMTGSFTPYNQENLSDADQDMGTGGCVLFDNPGGPPGHIHLLVTADKDGQIYLLDRVSGMLGGYMTNTNKDLQDFSDGGYHIHQSFAVFNKRLYLGLDNGPLSAWSFDAATGLFNTVPVTAPESTFGCHGCYVAGATPSISANGTSNAVVWAIDNSTYNAGEPAVLHAFDASLTSELYSSSMAPGDRDQADVAVKFTTPTIANGFVYVGGHASVTVYGLFKNAPPATAAPVFSPASGPQPTAILVKMSDRTPGAVIHYTTDDAIPTIASPTYTEPIAITSTTTLQAIGVTPYYLDSAIVEAAYVFGTPGSVFTIDSGFSGSELDLNGSAKVVDHRLRLTDGGTQEAGSAYYRSRVGISNFSTTFSFQLTDPNAHGIAFVLQNEGTTALGPSGSGLGYGALKPGESPGISPSAAIKFDLYDNDGEGRDSTGLYLDGVSPTVPAINLSGTPINLHSGHIFEVNLAYNGVTLVETITDTVTGKSFAHSYTVDLPATLGADTALAGFTGGTGGTSGLTVVSDIFNWSYSVPAVEVSPVHRQN
jgi:hypothetical protein